MAIKYKTFLAWEPGFCGNKQYNTHLMKMEIVDMEIEKLQKMGWKLQGGPWAQGGAIYLTAGKEE